MKHIFEAATSNFFFKKRVQYSVAATVLYLTLSFTNHFKITFIRDWNWARTQNHLVRKPTLDHLPSLAKW